MYKLGTGSKINNNWQTNIFIILFFILLAAIVSAPIGSTQYIANLADFICHLAAIVQAKMGLAEGQFPLRVMPLEHWGWRYPFYQFNSPTTYSFAGAIYYWLTNNPLIAFKITLWCGLTVGGFYIYRVSNWLVKSKPAAILAGTVYLFSPYYIIIIDRLGNLNESIALGIVPAVLYYTLRRYYFPKNQIITLQFTLAWYLLITVHILTFMYTSLFIGILFFCLTCKIKRHWENLIRVAMTYIFACLLALWYIAPIAIYEKYLLINATYAKPSALLDFSPTLAQLLFPSASITDGYRASALFTIHPGLGWPILIAVCLCLYLFFNKKFNVNRLANLWLMPLLIVFVIAFFLAWSPINVWQWLPHQLLAAQYCWRLLGQATWVGALLFAYAISWLFAKQLDLRHVIVGIILIASIASPWFPVSENIPTTLKDFIKKPLLLYNNNYFLMDFQHGKNVGQIDSFLIAPNNSPALNSTFTLPIKLFTAAKNPVIQIKSQLTKEIIQKHLQVTALIDNTPIATQALNKNKLEWNIPFSINTNKNKNSNIKLSFKINPTLQKKEDIKIDSILLTGFNDQTKTMGVKTIIPFCHLQKSTTICNLVINKDINLLILPIVYYPEMLRVMLNGKLVKYTSILTQGNLLTAIQPTSGKNIISIEFTGLIWANQLSQIAWVIWLILLALQLPALLVKLTANKRQDPVKIKNN